MLLHLWNWFLTVTGSNNTSGTFYGFWSGFGSDLGEVALLGAVVGWYRSNECHVDGCHRIGRHPFKHYKLCAKHHPQVPGKVTLSHINSLRNKDISNGKV